MHWEDANTGHRLIARPGDEVLNEQTKDELNRSRGRFANYAGNSYAIPGAGLANDGGMSMNFQDLQNGIGGPGGLTASGNNAGLSASIGHTGPGPAVPLNNAKSNAMMQKPAEERWTPIHSLPLPMNWAPNSEETATAASRNRSKSNTRLIGGGAVGTGAGGTVTPKLGTGMPSLTIPRIMKSNAKLLRTPNPIGIQNQEHLGQRTVGIADTASNRNSFGMPSIGIRSIMPVVGIPQTRSTTFKPSGGGLVTPSPPYLFHGEMESNCNTHSNSGQSKGGNSNFNSADSEAMS